MFRLNIDQIQNLIRLPESGMGYQVLRASVNGGEEQIFFALNSEFLFTCYELIDLAGRGLDDLLERTELVQGFQQVKLLPIHTGGLHIFPRSSSVRGSLGPLAPLPRIKRVTMDYEGFARVSAFPNDWRINPDGALEANSFATTVADLTMVPSGFAAAGRYALPCTASARFVSVIVPGPGVPIDGGTVLPANTQAGGGVEVCFVKGTPPHSVLQPYAIPEL